MFVYYNEDLLKPSKIIKFQNIAQRILESKQYLKNSQKNENNQIFASLPFFAKSFSQTEEKG